MGVLFGLLTSLSITTSEFFSRRITNEIGPLVAACSASLIAAFVALGVALVGDGTPLVGDMVIGAVSGLGFGGGMVAYLQGVRVSSSAVVAPSTAALSTLIPFVYAAVRDAQPSGLAVIGAVAIVAGLGLVTIDGAEASNVREGLPLGLLSGFGYGTGTAALIETTADSGGWSLVSQRTISFVAIAAFALARRRPVVPPKRLAGSAAGAGLFAGASSVLLLAGLTANPAAASVTASLFPASSAIAGRMFFRDAVSRWQAFGLAIVVVGIIIVVVG